MNYEWNKEAEELAGRIILDYHRHLEGVKIAYLFKEKPEPAKPKRKSKKVRAARPGRAEIWAKASRVPARYAELLTADYEFLIEFDRAVWDQLKPAQQKALVDHELCHCGKDSRGAYMKCHDLEEFGDIVKRHGLWRDSVRVFGESIHPLFDATVDPAIQHRGSGPEQLKQDPEPQRPAPQQRRRGKGKPLAPGAQAPLME